MADATISDVVRRTTTAKLPDGRDVRISALGLKEYAELERRALDIYTTNQTSALKKQRDMMSEEAFYAEARRIRELQPADLPDRNLSMPRRHSVTGDYLKDENGKLLFQNVSVPYSAWWMAETPEGWLYASYLAIRREQPDMTLDQVDTIFCNAQSELQELANKIGDLTEPRLGKDSSPKEAEPTATETSKAAPQTGRD
jgi:hypothetical protein